MAVPRLLHRSLVDGILLALVLAGAGLAAEPEVAEKPAEPAATVEAAEKDRKKPLRIPEATDKPIVTEHAITLGETTLEYRAETGMLPLLSEEGTPRAGVFYVAYTAKPAGDPATRPVMFCFNGGPGAASVWLHLGGLGPRRAKVNDDGTLPPPPFGLVDNAHTLLPAADLVFIDPVATGYSRPAKDQRADQFFGAAADISAVADFIRLWTTRARRWRSPKYLCGESYGVFRAAGLARRLQDEHGMFLNGLVLVSGLVDFQTIHPGPSNDLPYATFLPGFTAVAAHHGKLAADLSGDLPAALAEARAFAAGEYATALFAGASLPAERRAAVARQLARLSGLPEKLILDHDLRVDPGLFQEKLLADEGLICGRFDGRITGRDGSAAGSRPGFDPSFTAALGPLSSAMNAYVREELGYESDLPYKVLAGVGPWPYEQNAYANTADDLADAMHENPHLRVLVLVGLCDLAVPCDAMRHSVDHLRLDRALRDNITFAEYTSGHMMYLNLPDLARMEADLARFVSPP